MFNKAILNKYIGNVKNKINTLEMKIKGEQNISSQITQERHINEQINLLRRDVNDLHSIIMLRSSGEKIPKKNRIVFIGTGQINENVIHSYIHLQNAIKNNEIKLDWDILFVARSEREEQLLNNYGFPCMVWRYQPELALYLLETKIIVLSSHLYSNWGDNLLTHCLASAIKIELWHGLPAKNIGASCINNGLEFHFFARLLEDCVSTNYVCIQNNHKDVVDEYKRAFPYAKQYITGDCRNDLLFNEKYRKQFLNNKSNKNITNWFDDNKSNIKVLYAPTYRETPKTISDHYLQIINLLSVFDNSNIKLALKLHVGIVLTAQQKNEIGELCKTKGHLFIEDMDEVYSTFNDFDALIVDYSSIRVDFALTNKPIFLWRFDQNAYFRKTDVVKTFEQLDQVSYVLSDNFSANEFISKYETDELKEKRIAFVESELKPFSNGKSAERTIQAILDIIEKHK